MRYESNGRVIEIIGEDAGICRARILVDPPTLDDDGNPIPSQVGREFDLKKLQLLSCYNPLPPEPPLTD